LCRVILNFNVLEFSYSNSDNYKINLFIIIKKNLNTIEIIKIMSVKYDCKKYGIRVTYDFRQN